MAAADATATFYRVLLHPLQTLSCCMLCRRRVQSVLLTRSSKSKTFPSPPSPHIQGVRLALGPLRHPKPGTGGRNGPLVGLGVRNFDAGAKFRALFLVWALHAWGSKTSKCELTKNHRNHQWIDHQCMSFDTKNVLIVKMRFFFFEISSLLFFCTVFSTFCGTVVKKKIMRQGSPFSRFLGPLGPF